jgi:hypothetical protein
LTFLGKLLQFITVSCKKDTLKGFLGNYKPNQKQMSLVVEIQTKLKSKCIQLFDTQTKTKNKCI